MVARRNNNHHNSNHSSAVVPLKERLANDDLEQQEEEGRGSTTSSTSSSSDPCVLILNGWSPGPLWYLKRTLRQQQTSLRIIEPVLDMPPVGIRWCCNTRFALLVALYGYFIWYARHLCAGLKSQESPAYYQCLLLSTFMGLVWFRALVSEVVRYSMQRNVDLCQRLLSQNSNVVLIIGFSWGGAVGAELAAQGLLHQSHLLAGRNNNEGTAAAAGYIESSPLEEGEEANRTTSIPCLLVAPTTALVSKLCVCPPYRKDAALRLNNAAPPQQQPQVHENTTTTNNNNDTLCVHVVHGEHDGFFCPHPERWQPAPSQENATSSLSSSLNNNNKNHPHMNGIQLTMLNDNHVFQHLHSQREITRIMTSLLNHRMRNNR
ncbi:hypothetical protein ACA910_013993 [Epithemia clementina (nom. ined.)]